MSYLLAALLVSLLLAACTSSKSLPGQYILNSDSSAASEDPQTSFQVREYPLIEQSLDNPDHPEFIEYIPPAGSARLLAQSQEAIQTVNLTLADFGYQLSTATETGPGGLRAYVLSNGDQPVASNIRQFWPVTRNNAGDDFLLPFETTSGERLVASLGGINSWQEFPSASNTPIYIGDRLAYAAIDGDALSVLADSQALTNIPTDRVFQWHYLHGKPFYLFEEDGLVRASYGGKILPFGYDQVVAGDTPATALFRPGSNPDLVWFIALRDGLWYFVEAGYINPS